MQGDALASSPTLRKELSTRPCQVPIGAGGDNIAFGKAGDVYRRTALELKEFATEFDLRQLQRLFGTGCFTCQGGQCRQYQSAKRF